MSSFNQQLSVSGTIKPSGVNDTYPTHEARFGKGGCMQADTIAVRNAIPADRRVEGMLVIVTGEGDNTLNKVYILDGGITNDDWRPLDRYDLYLPNNIIISNVAPTTRENGSPLESGDFWWDSTGNSLFYVYISDAWQPVYTLTNVIAAGTYGGQYEQLQLEVDQHGRITDVVEFSASNIFIPYSSEPTTREGGSALQDGDLWWNTNLGRLYVRLIGFWYPVYTIPALTGDVTTTVGSTTTTLSATGVAANTYGDTNNIPQITVDTKGRITSASNVAISQFSLPDVATPGTFGDTNSVAQFTLDSKGRITNATNVAITKFSLPDITTAGTYGDANSVAQVTIDTKGRVTSATEVALSTFALPDITAAGTYGGQNTFLQATLDSTGRVTNTATFALDADLVTIAGLNGMGYARRTGEATWTLREVDYNELLNRPFFRVDEDLHLYVNATTGSDGNTGLTEQSPLLTLQKAIITASFYIVPISYKVVIHLADGTYPMRCVIPPLLSYEIHIIGNEGNPSAVHLTGTSANSYLSSVEALGAKNRTLLISGSYCTITGVKISGSYPENANFRHGVTVQFGGTAILDNCQLADCHYGLDVQQQGHGVVQNAFTASGSFFRVFSSGDKLEIRNAYMTLNSLWTEQAFILLTNNSSGVWYSSVVVNTGSAPTGKYYIINQGSTLVWWDVTNGAGGAPVYGSLSGTVDTGGAIYG